jgi:hypothetical protein
MNRRIKGSVNFDFIDLLENICKFYNIMIEKIKKHFSKNSSIISIIIGIVLFFFISEYKLNSKEELNNLLTNLIQFSGIFSAVLVTLVISKIFQIRQEKVNLIDKVEELCNKVTDVRRIAIRLINTYGFWNPTMKNYMDANYKVLDKCLIDEIGENSKHKYYELKQNLNLEFGQTGSANTEEYNARFYGYWFYFDLRALVKGDENNIELMYSIEDKNLIYRSEKILRFYQSHCGDFWTFFSKDYKGGVYSNDFNIAAIKKDYKEDILILAEKIDSRFKNRQLGNELLADIGSIFTSQIVPKLLSYLSIFESGLPEIITKLNKLLLIIFLFGLIIPISLSAMVFKPLILKIFLTNICLSMVLVGIVYFLINAIPIYRKTIDISDLVTTDT